MHEELKLCPFCGGASAEVRGWTNSMGDEGFGVNCTDCDADGPSKLDRTDAIAAWNRRAPQKDDSRD